MRLFDISAQIEALLNASVDPETGEVREDALDELTKLEEARDAKALAVAAYVLGQEAEADAIEAQAKRLRDRAQVHRNHAERLRRYIAESIQPGAKLANDCVAIGWRRSEAVEIEDESKLGDDCYRVKREIDKAGIRQAIKDGLDVPGARLVTRMSVQIK